MIKTLTLSCFFLLIAFASFSQSTTPSSVKIVNDPLLWKNMLKLKSNQKNRIMEINEAFYSKIITPDPERQHITRAELSELMQQRSEGIWNTFSSKQKQIWKKLAASYSANTHEGITL